LGAIAIDRRSIPIIRIGDPFQMIAEQENDIRRNPVARTSDLLRRVFGGR
jgi:hypothetical protein